MMFKNMSGSVISQHVWELQFLANVTQTGVNGGRVGWGGFDVVEYLWRPHTIHGVDLK